MRDLDSTWTPPKFCLAPLPTPLTGVPILPDSRFGGAVPVGGANCSGALDLPLFKGGVLGLIVGWENAGRADSSMSSSSSKSSVSGSTVRRSNASLAYPLE